MITPTRTIEAATHFGAAGRLNPMLNPRLRCVRPGSSPFTPAVVPYRIRCSVGPVWVDGP